MSIQNSALVRDNSTLANFKQWASTISAFFTTAGWTQSSDTGQVNWSTIASVPAVNTYVYEIWQPNDALTTFYFKVEYGTGSASSSTSPAMRISLSTGTNGAGTLTGFITALQVFPVTSPAVTSTVTQWQCYFSGAPGRVNVMMWRDDTASSGGLFFAVERSLNASGAYTSAFVTLLGCGNNNGSQGGPFQQSLIFGQGVANAVAQGVLGSGFICLRNSTVPSDIFDGGVPLSPVFPSVGGTTGFANPMLAAAVGAASDYSEGSTYTIAAANMPYGVTHNYLASGNGPFSKVGVAQFSNSKLLMRYD
jgi:hypothetical protein